MEFGSCASPRFGLEVKSDLFSFQCVGFVESLCGIWLMALQSSFRNSFSGCCIRIVLACQRLLLQQNTLQTSSSWTSQPLQIVQLKAVRRVPVSGPSWKCHAATGHWKGRSHSKTKLAIFAAAAQLNCQSHFPNIAVRVFATGDTGFLFTPTFAP